MVSDLDYIEMKRGSAVRAMLLGLFIGAVAGGVTALLLAPRSGRETQAMLRDRAKQTQQMLQERVNTVKARVGKVRESMRSRAEEEMQSVDKSQ